jgi:hypothetical protein
MRNQQPVSFSPLPSLNPSIRSDSEEKLMNPYEGFDGMIQQTQRMIDGYDGIANVAIREFERLDRMARESDRVDRLAQEMELIDRLTRAIEPFRGIQEQTQSAVLRHVQSLQLQDKMVHALAPFAAAEESYLDSLIRSQEALLQVATASAEQQRASDFWRLTKDFHDRAVLTQAVGTIAERILRETALREGLVSSLISNYASIPTTVAPVSKDYEELFGVLVRGFDETGLTQSELSYQTILWRFDAWLETLPPNIKKIVIGIIIGMAVVVFTSAVDSCKNALKRQGEVPKNAALAEPKHADTDVGPCP